MGNRLSHSQVSKYQQCGKAYEFWYLKKIRPTKVRAALLFGSALDKAIGARLDDTKANADIAHKTFDEYWEHQEINGVRTFLPLCPEIVYAKSDFDKDLLTAEDYENIGETSEKVLEIIDRRTQVGHNGLTVEQKTIANHAMWICLQKKGRYMIGAFEDKVLHRLTKIHSTQEYIELDNGQDKVIGYIDIVAEVEGYPEPIVLDLKTSAMEYGEDSVITSPQLSLYVHAVSEKYKTRKAGYIVLNKNLIKNRKKICSVCSYDGSGGRHKTCANEINNKRCGGEWKETINPEVYVQFIVDEIPSQTEDLVLENIDDINTAIKTGHFTRNLSMCTNTFGGLCDYINLCYKGKMDDLKKQGE
jgi:hypothetical protein